LPNTVLVTQPLPDQYLARLAEHAELDVLDAGESLSDPALGTRRSACCGVVCTLTDTIDRALLKDMNMLKFVSSVSVGVDHIDVSALSVRGIALGNTPGVLADATADTAFALLLAAARRIAEGDRYIRDGKWTASNRWSPGFFLGKDVSGSTLGIVGLGPVGQAMARRAAGFGMTVASWTPSGRKVPGVCSLSLEALLATSDFVSVHVALADTTRNLINGARIATMKPGAVLINTARGGIVDESAVAAALDDGRLFAAGLDVFEEEPVPADSLLLKHPRVVVVPHIGSATASTRLKMADRAVVNAVAALRDEPMPYCVNPEVYAAL
jgi:glyoxylate reductase